MPETPQKLRQSRWQRFLNDSSLIREYLSKYRRWVGMGLLALLIVDGLEIIPPILLKKAVDVATSQALGLPKIERELLSLALVYLGVAFIQALGRYGWRIWLIRASMYSGRDLRGRFADHLFGLCASFFDKRRIGELMSNATSDVEAVRMSIGAGLLTLADAAFYFITVPIAMLWLSPKLALLAFLPLPIVPFLVLRNEREVHSRFTRVQEQFSTLAALAQENLNGIRVVKGFARENAQIARFSDAGREYIRLSLRLARVQTSFGPTMEFCMSLGMVFLLWVGGKGVLEGAVTLGTFVAFQRYIQKMVWPMAAVALAFNTYQRAVASSERLKEVMGCRTDVPEDPEPRYPEGYAPGGAWRTRGEVEFRSLTFAFPGAPRAVLQDFTLRIQPGERVAVVGAIGAGKSALLGLLPRLYPVSPGMLFVDGVDVNRWGLEELRRQVGYVGQEVFLFSESVLENVAYGLHEWVGSGRDQAIESATALSSVHQDVLGLVDGYKTRLGERGVNLSGGQKQRLTIARAIAKQPSILVLDDALSSVDVQTEERILTALRGRAQRNTELIAAHRISTVKDADRIVVLENGLIRQLGTHAQLIQDRRGIYRRFYDQQQLKEDLESFLEQVEAGPA